MRSRPASLLVLGAAIVVAGASLVVMVGPARQFSVLGRGSADGVLAVTAAVALIAAGAAVIGMRPWWRGGAVLLGAGCAQLLPAWVGWGDTWLWLRPLAAGVAWFAPPLLAHAIARAPDSRLGPQPPRGVSATIVWIGYATAATGALLQVFAANPHTDPRCWADCAPNPLAIVESRSVADAAWPVLTAVQAALFLAIAWLAGARAVEVGPGRRAVPMLAAIAGGAAAAGRALVAIAVAQEGTDDPALPLAQTALALGSAGGLLVSALYFVSIAQGRRRRSRLEAIVPASPSAGIQQALRGALRDPDLRVVYWLPELERYADALGRPVPSLSSDRPELLTTLARDGQTIAWIQHAVEPPDLEREIGPALTVAIHNEYLQAHVHAQLAALREARIRIVERADTHRRNLERDLHDGVQQLLIALGARIRSAAEVAGGEAAGPILATAVLEVRRAIDDLRVVAHGIFPAVLANDGLAAALRAYAVGAPLPVELGSIETARFEPGVEAAAYAFVIAAVDNASQRGASHAEVSVESGADVVVRVSDDAADPPWVSVHTADRIGAIGGVAELAPGSVTALIPYPIRSQG